MASGFQCIHLTPKRQVNTVAIVMQNVHVDTRIITVRIFVTIPWYLNATLMLAKPSSEIRNMAMLLPKCARETIVFCMSRSTVNDGKLVTQNMEFKTPTKTILNPLTKSATDRFAMTRLVGVCRISN